MTDSNHDLLELVELTITSYVESVELSTQDLTRGLTFEIIDPRGNMHFLVYIMRGAARDLIQREVDRLQCALAPRAAENLTLKRWQTFTHVEQKGLSDDFRREGRRRGRF